MSTRICEFRPGGALEDSVDAFWIHADDRMGRRHADTAPEPSPGTRVARILPDGCFDLIFRWRRCPSDGHLAAAQLFVAGARLRAHTVAIEPGTRFAAVRLRPAMSRLLIDADPTALVGCSTPAGALGSDLAALNERLCATAETNPAAVLALLRSYTGRVAAINGIGRPPDRVREALALLSASDQPMRIEAVAAAIGITPRSLHRDIVAWTGLAPKTLGRILRLQAAVKLAAREPDASLAGTAQAVGYADQAHMTRDFRDLAGESPARLLRGAAGRQPHG